MTRIAAAPVPLALMMLLAGCLAVCFAQEDAKTSTDPVDKFVVPDGDVPQLVKYIEDLKAFQPGTQAELQEYQVKGPIALAKAADKILKLEKDETSKAHRLATLVSLEQKVRSLPRQDPTERAAILDETLKYVAGIKEMETAHLQLAVAVPQILDLVGSQELAATAYNRFGELFVKNDNEGIAGIGQQLLAAARRLSLVGNEMELKGTTLSGKEFDLTSLKGKVVLVDFWATWCGPCVAEIPFMKEMYEKYHGKGFEIVGISLDQNRGAVEQFVEGKELPWPILHDEANGGQHPAAEYYGIMAIPAMFLVGRDGKVVSLNAIGNELERLLEERFDPKGSGTP